MLGMGKNTVEIIIAAKDRTSAAFAKVNTQMKTMGGTTGRLKSSMGSLTGKMSALVSSINPVMIAAGAAAIALATMGGAAIKASLEFEKAVATIRVGTGATGKALAGLEESFKTVFTAVPTTTAAAATAIADLNTRLGLTGEPLEALATQFLNLSRITGTDVAASISSATRVMHDFAVSSEDQAGALDYLFKVSQSTGIGMTNLANNMTRYGGVMRQMGFDINTSAALLGKFEKEGVNLELVLSSLRMGLANFARAGEEPVEALKRVIAEIQGMGSAADRNLKAIEIFGARSGPDMAAAIYEGRFSIEELMATLDASSETINKAAADALTFGDTWTLFKNKIMTAIEPIGDVILNVLGGAMNTAMAAFDLASENIKKFKAAIAPLTNLIGDLYNKLSGGHSIIQNLKDVVTVLWAGLKLLGDAIIWLIKNAISVFVNHIRETIKELTNLYNKLEPLKDLIGFVKDVVDKGVEGFHNYAESFREVEKEADNLMDRLDATIEELEGVKNKAAEVPVAIVKEWRLAVDAFEEGTGSYKDAIGAFDAEIEKLTVLWKRASEEEKDLYEDWIRNLIKQKEAMIEADKIATETLNRNIGLTKEAIEETKEFIVTIGDTIIEFKGAAAEVLKNADAYDKLQKSARTLIDLDWSVFTEFEASLPRIDAGLGDMESSFVGLKGVLEDNIDKLEEIEQAVMDISEIAAPFLEAGFLNGIKAIGNFAGALKDASSAIGDFSSLQDVSIEGCIKFSEHIYDMVTALEILEGQMEDLMPAFGNMDSLMQDVVSHFIWTGGRKETIADNLNQAATALRQLDQDRKAGIITEKEYWKQMRENINVTDLMYATTSASYQSFYQYLERYRYGVEDVDDVTKDFLNTSGVAEKQMDKQTGALKFQTEQLNKITEALQPYLEFMRTLNELAALSTLSTEELNNGLNAINDTLVNLGTALSSFDLRAAMEGLFSPDTGTAKGFMDVMADYNVDFSLFVTTLIRVTDAISGLSIAMANAAGMVVISAKEMETALALIPAQLEEIEKFLMSDLWGEITTMIFAVNVQWEKWAFAIENTDFTKVTSTLSSLLNLMSSMKGTFADTSDQVVVSVKEIEQALALIPAQLEEIEKFLMTDLWGEITTMIFAVGVQWQKDAEIMEDYMPSFNAAIDTISTLASKVLSLSASLIELRDMSVLSVRDIDEALKNIPIFLDRFVDALALNMGAIKQSLKELDVEWQKHAEDMKDTIPSYEDSTSQIGKLVGSLLSLGSALKSLAETGIITEREFDVGFKSLMTSISNFAVSLSNNVDALIYSLQKLRVVWMENEDVLFPLIRDFAIITDNLWGVAHNANRMAEEFSNISKNSRTLEEGFKSLIEFINQVVESTEEFYTTEAAGELARFIEDVGEVIEAFVDLERELNTAMGTIKKAIGTAVDDIAGKISSLSTLSTSAFWWGANMMGSYVNGIYSMSAYLREALEAHAGLVESYLGTYSNAKTGPLSRLDEWPHNLIQSYSAGIESEMNTLNSSFAGMVAGPAVMGGGGGNKNINLYVTQNIGSRSDADYATQGLERMLQRHAIM